VLYGSIYASTREKETLVSLQEKLLYILAVLQGADAKPTAQMLEAINALKTRVLEIKQDFSKLVPEKNP
jgi:hypothetical protein